MKNNKLKKLIDKLNPQVMYFTENPINYMLDDKYYGYKYFLVWQNTHSIYKAFKTQNELIDELKELIEQKIVWKGTRGFVVVKDLKL